MREAFVASHNLLEVVPFVGSPFAHSEQSLPHHFIVAEYSDHVVEAPIMLPSSMRQDAPTFYPIGRQGVSSLFPTITSTLDSESQKPRSPDCVLAPDELPAFRLT